MLAEKMMGTRNFDIDEEIKNLELLKLRCGDSSLQVSYDKGIFFHESHEWSILITSMFWIFDLCAFFDLSDMQHHSQRCEGFQKNRQSHSRIQEINHSGG
jgi:hypothetical protein